MGRLGFFFAAFALIFVVSCGGSAPGGVGPGGGGPGPSGQGSANFTAVIDGQSWASDANTVQVTVAAATIPGSLILSGTKVSGQEYTNLTFSLGYIGAPGTYPLGVNHGTNAGGTAAVSIQANGSLGSWNTGFAGNAGTINITTLTGTRIAGTFEFRASPQIGTSVTGDKVVTAGQFDVALPTALPAVPPANRGSKVSATLDGAPWNGATIVSVGSGGVFVTTAMTSGHNLTFNPEIALKAGQSYPIGAGKSGVRMTVLDVKTGKSWGGFMGDVGTFTVTTLDADRATGTFNATLQANGGATGSLAVANGTFDVKVLDQSLRR